MAGIAGVNPKRATTGSAAAARFAVLVALQYEIDIWEPLPSYPTGHAPLGAYFSSKYPRTIYRKEVFEVNADLSSMAASLARQANLPDSAAA